MHQGAGSSGTPRADAAARAVPSQRDAGPTDSAQVLRGLGLETLVQLVESAGHGICITGDDHTWLYVNPAGQRLLGRSFEELAGTDYLLCFPEHERAALLALEQEQRAGDTGFYTNTLVRPDGTETEMTWSGSVVISGDRELAPAVFHETAGIRRAQRAAAALGAAADRMAAGGSTDEVLRALADDAVSATRACASVVLVTRDDGLLHALAWSGVPDSVADAVDHARLGLAQLPGGAALRDDRTVVLSDGRTRLRQLPATASLAASTGALDWEGAALLALRQRGEVVGCLAVLLPRGLRVPSEPELAFWSSLTDQAAVAMANQRLQQVVARSAAAGERERIARELHDSVSQGLFSLHTRAEVIRRALDRDDRDLLRAAAADLDLLATSAVTEMRQLLAELRPPPPAPADDLLGAVRAVAERTSGRDGLPVEVRTDGSVPAVPASTAEHLCRIVGEALHNVAKHAAASRAVVELSLRGSEVVLAVVDDGAGFDPSAVAGDRHGQRTMHERARLCGGWLTVDSAPRRGTTVTVRVPLPG